MRAGEELGPIGYRVTRIVLDQQGRPSAYEPFAEGWLQNDKVWGRPVDVLTEVVRSYTSQAANVVPQFLATSFEMLRQGQGPNMRIFVMPGMGGPGR